MKHLYLFAGLLAISHFSISQTLTPRTDGTTTPVDERLAVAQTFSIPAGPVPTLNGGLARQGSLFYNLTDRVLYIYNGSAWSPIRSIAHIGATGGQTLIGSTNSGGNLILSSTSDATKGKIIIGNSSIDEANNRIGINIPNPPQALSVGGNAFISGQIYAEGIENVNSRENAMFQVTNTGVRAMRNQPDSNPAMEVFQVHAASSGNIFQWRNSAALQGVINQAGHMGIGTTDPGTNRLAVNGTIKANEIKVDKLLINTTTDDGSSKLQVNGAVSASRLNLADELFMKPGKYISLADGRANIMGTYTGMELRLANNDDTTIPDYSKSFKFRNRGVHYMSMGSVPTNGGGNDPLAYNYVNFSAKGNFTGELTAPSLVLNTVPVTSEASYDVLTRNASTGAIEKIPAASLGGGSGNKTFEGNVGIGTSDPGAYRLAVNGNIRAKEIKVESGWADFVFEPEYKLMPLKDVSQYIKENKHLPEIPSAAEVEKDGIGLGEMNKKLLQKIEELTLYIIEQEKRISKLEKKKD